MSRAKVGRPIGWRSYIGLAVFLLVAISIPVGYRFLRGSRGEGYHQLLLREFQKIQPLSQSTVVQTTDSYSPWRPSQALVGANYSTLESLDVIRRHYEKELIANGWRVVDDRAITGWGKDFGGRTIEYCKGPLEASLQYAGLHADYGWTFAFELSWGLGNGECR